MLLACTLLAPSRSAQAAILWVGSSAQCTGPGVYGSLSFALQIASFSSEDDDIRLTTTLSYTDDLALVDWHPGGFGGLTSIAEPAAALSSTEVP